MSRDGIYMKNDVLKYYIEELTPEEFKIYFKIRSEADGLGNWIARATFDPISEKYITPIYKQMRVSFTDTQIKTALSTLMNRRILNITFLEDGNEIYVLHSLLDASKTNKEIVLTANEIDYYKIHGWWQQLQVKDGVFYITAEKKGTKISNLLQNEKRLSGGSYRIKDIRSKEDGYNPELLSVPSTVKPAIEAPEVIEVEPDITTITSRLKGSREEKEEFAKQVINQNPALASDETFLERIEGKWVGEAYKVLRTHDKGEYKEVKHKKDKVEMSLDDYVFLSEFNRVTIETFSLGVNQEERIKQLDETLAKYGLTGYKEQVLNGHINLNDIAYVKKEDNLF